MAEAQEQEQAVSRNAEQQARDAKCRTAGHRWYITIWEGERVLNCVGNCSISGTQKVVPRG